MNDTTAQSSDDPVIVIHINKLKGLLAAGVTGLLRIVGSAVVTHHLATQGIVDSSIPGIATEVTGALMVAIGQGWAWYREGHKNSKIVQAAQDGAIVVQEGPIK